MLMRRRRATYSTYSLRRSWKSPLPPTVSSAVSSSEPSFAGALAASIVATSIAVAKVAVSKDEGEKDGIFFFSSSSLPKRRTG